MATVTSAWYHPPRAPLKDGSEPGIGTGPFSETLPARSCTPSADVSSGKAPTGQVPPVGVSPDQQSLVVGAVFGALLPQG